MNIDIAKLIAYFGGVGALADSLNQMKEPVTAAAIYKWRKRGSLPLYQLQKLTDLAQAQGRPLDLNAFIQNTNRKWEETMRNNKQIIIFDTTLRDGEQSPGAAMRKEEKLRIALQLEKMGVDVIEAGFAAASPGDFDAIHSIAQMVKTSTICSLSRANEKDIRLAGEAVAPAASGRIHTFIATSPLHMTYKLRKKPAEVIEAAIKAVKFAGEFTHDIEFSAEDASRSDIDFLVEVFSAVIDAGATTLNVPDTVGYAVPFDWHEKFKEIIGRTHNSDKVIWSTHCHNDLGMAVANSLASVQAGVRQIECTINGLGERAGNTSLEEVVMALKTRSDLFHLNTNIDATQIVPSSKLVSMITGYPIQPNKAIVGANAFAHESGIHQDGILKCRETYEIMSAESVGWQKNRLTLGKLSGRNAFKSKLHELGIFLESEEALNAAFSRFKELADKKREIFDDDLHALISDEMKGNEPDRYKLISLKTYMETGETPIASIVFSKDGQEFKAEASGNGQVDSVFKAIEHISPSGAQLELYSVNAVTSGTESQAEVTVRLEKDGRIVNGQGADIDVIVASAKAYLAALSKLQFTSETIRAQGAI